MKSNLCVTLRIHSSTTAYIDQYKVLALSQNTDWAGGSKIIVLVHDVKLSNGVDIMIDKKFRTQCIIPFSDVNEYFKDFVIHRVFDGDKKAAIVRSSFCIVWVDNDL